MGKFFGRVVGLLNPNNREKANGSHDSRKLTKEEVLALIRYGSLDSDSSFLEIDVQSVLPPTLRSRIAENRIREQHLLEYLLQLALFDNILKSNATGNMEAEDLGDNGNGNPWIRRILFDTYGNSIKCDSRTKIFSSEPNEKEMPVNYYPDRYNENGVDMNDGIRMRYSHSQVIEP